MILLNHPRATKPAAVIEGREDYKITDGNADGAARASLAKSSPYD